MKTLTQITLAALAIHPLNSICQTLTCADNCPKAGQIFAIRTSSPVSNATGQNIVWNYSGVPQVSAAYSFVSYNAASSAPGASLYPQADLVRNNSVFLKTGNGFVQSVSANSVTASADIVELPLPFSYGSSYSQTVTVTSVTGSNTLVTTYKLDFLADGSGTLILPGGVFADVLKIKKNVDVVKTLNGQPYGNLFQDRVNMYYAKGISHPVLYMSQPLPSGNNDYGPYTAFIDPLITALQDNIKMDQGFSVYPNPAAQTVIVQMDEEADCTLQICDQVGNMVRLAELKSGASSAAVHDLPSGIYLVSIVGRPEKGVRKLVILN